MAVEVARARVVAVGVLVTLGVVNNVIAIFIPLIPIIIGRPVGYPILRVIFGAMNDDVLALAHSSAALRSRNVGLAVADRDHGVAVRVHFNAVTPLAQRVDGDIGR